DYYCSIWHTRAYLF
nr:immunoglobulin light chain junction region [Macaca mulatta]MOX28501.1 immunoglobulin light chain junction region [Macaca mulatta]MOX29289.1 immunoglobulin light chain junction region [Macaca mulatta]MOX29460.1 immunoglobulin light chain junction region [Macaca mulatta]MOX29588.1 immunoglobulin light chain junction region [Macaca mulatta]